MGIRRRWPVFDDRREAVLSCALADVYGVILHPSDGLSCRARKRLGHSVEGRNVSKYEIRSWQGERIRSSSRTDDKALSHPRSHRNRLYGVCTKHGCLQEPLDSLEPLTLPFALPRR